eukprot:3590286-Pyramimonas_sp.AAC.1
MVVSLVSFRVKVECFEIATSSLFKLLCGGKISCRDFGALCTTLKTVRGFMLRACRKAAGPPAAPWSSTKAAGRSPGARKAGGIYSESVSGSKLG